MRRKADIYNMLNVWYGRYKSLKTLEKQACFGDSSGTINDIQNQLYPLELLISVFAWFMEMELSFVDSLENIIGV